MVFEEDLEQLFVADLGRVVAHLDDLGMPGTSAADLLVGGVGREASRVTNCGVGNPRCIPKQLLGPPEATKSKVGNLRTLRHLLHRNAKDVMEGWINQNWCVSALQCLIGLDKGGLHPREQHGIQSAFLQRRYERSLQLRNADWYRHVPGVCALSLSKRRGGPRQAQGAARAYCGLL